MTSARAVWPSMVLKYYINVLLPTDVERTFTMTLGGRALGLWGSTLESF